MSLGLNNPAVSVAAGAVTVIFPYLTIKLLSSHNVSRGSSIMMALSGTAVAIAGLIIAAYNPAPGFITVAVVSVALFFWAWKNRPEHTGPLLGEAQEPISLLIEAQKYATPPPEVAQAKLAVPRPNPRVQAPQNAQSLEEWLAATDVIANQPLSPEQPITDKEKGADLHITIPEELDGNRDVDASSGVDTRPRRPPAPAPPAPSAPAPPAPSAPAPPVPLGPSESSSSQPSIADEEDFLEPPELF